MATMKKSTPKRSEAELQRDIYSPLVTKLDDNHVLKTNVELVKSKENLNAKPDYIMQIKGNWTPLEVFSTAINENFRVPLERICKYAHNSSFRDQSHADDSEKEPTAITPPHGFVLIGDAQTIYLGYASTADIGVNPELEPGHTHGFVYQNDKPVSWHVSPLSDALIQDMRNTVQEYIAASQKSPATLTIKDTLPPPTNYTQLRHQLRNTRITSPESLTEKQLQELLYNPVVKEIDDKHELKTNIVLLKSKANRNAEPDYIMQINGNWTPLEIFATAINENTRVPLERICKYAYNGSFRDESHAGNNEKEPTAITPPHGFVLIGDAQTIYLGYASTADIGVSKELEPGTHTHGFVYQNDKPVSWQVSALSDALIQDMRNTVQEYIATSQKSKAILTIKSTLPAPIDIVAALQPLRPYVGGNADLMDNVASLADEIKGLPKTRSPIENLCLCTPVGDNVYFTRIDDVWFPVHINYAGTPTAIDYKKYTYVEEFKVPSAIIPIEQPHGISLVASLQGIDIMYTDENGKTTKSLKKIAINTTSIKARQTILECYSDHE
jgi:hypothetical protein